MGRSSKSKSKIGCIMSRYDLRIFGLIGVISIVGIAVIVALLISPENDVNEDIVITSVLTGAFTLVASVIGAKQASKYNEEMRLNERNELYMNDLNRILLEFRKVYEHVKAINNKVKEASLLKTSIAIDAYIDDLKVYSEKERPMETGAFEKYRYLFMMDTSFCGHDLKKLEDDLIKFKEQLNIYIDQYKHQGELYKKKKDEKDDSFIDAKNLLLVINDMTIAFEKLDESVPTQLDKDTFRLKK